MERYKKGRNGELLIVFVHPFKGLEPLKGLERLELLPGQPFKGLEPLEGLGGVGTLEGFRVTLESSLKAIGVIQRI